MSALIAFSIVATGAALIARRIARSDALAEAVRSAHVMSNTVFAPLLPGAINGDSAAIARLDDAVRTGQRDGSLVRVKVWRRDGTVIYSDDHRAIGGRFPLHADVADTIDRQKDNADLSNLNDPENVTENHQYHRLVEVYIPLNLADGGRYAFEMYSSDARVVAAEHGLQSQLVPFGLLALLILVVSQLPVSVWLLRRVGRAQSERSRLLNSALAASGRERRAIARDLHDGVVQDLAGAGYAMDALLQTLPPDTAAQSRSLADTVGAALTKSVGSLRTLMVDIYPPDLTADGLQLAIEGLANKLRPGVQVTVDVDLETEPSAEVAAMVYRCARECLANVATHAKADRADVLLTGDGDTIQLLISDDGVGLPPHGIDRRADGHFGLQMLRDAAADLGGELRLSSEDHSGTTAVLELPTESAGFTSREP